VEEQCRSGWEKFPLGRVNLFGEEFKKSITNRRAQVCQESGWYAH